MTAPAHRYEPGTCPQCEASREALSEHLATLAEAQAENDRLRAALGVAHDLAEQQTRALVDAVNPRRRGR